MFHILGEVGYSEKVITIQDPSTLSLLQSPNSVPLLAEEESWRNVVSKVESWKALMAYMPLSANCYNAWQRLADVGHILRPLCASGIEMV